MTDATISATSSLSKKRKPTVSGGNETRQSIAEARKNLPVFQFRRQVCTKIMNHDVVLVMSETGSGKSTQVPQYLLELPFVKKYPAQSIVVTQPRRVACITVAQRVAKERNCRLGTEVGYRVRFDDKTGHNTRLIYATDGMLLRQAMLDPLLSAYSIIILDEAHQRSLQTDVLFGACKRAMEARKKAAKSSMPLLKVVVMSATLDVETFENFFRGADKIQIPGRQFPVQVIYTKEPQDDYIDAALCATLQIHEESEDGDILVFLPGQEEIEDLAQLLKNHLDDDANLGKSLTGDVVQSLQGIGKDLSKTATIVNGVLVCVLYAALPPELQMLAFQPKPEGCSRKIILSTNIAETSVTLEGIRYIVDTGKHKTREFSSATGMESLLVKDISKAQAAQRTGRAGRVSHGYCFRLFTEEAFESLDDMTTPEILRVSLAQVVLQLKGMGVEDPMKFEFVTPPDVESLKSACRKLYALGALDERMKLTNYGTKLARLPVEPVFAHLLLQSATYGCTTEMLIAVSMLSAENIMYRPSGDQLASKAAEAHRRFASHEGDLPTFLNVYHAWRSEAIYISPSTRTQKSKEKRSKEQQKGKILHGEWCRRNFISSRSLARAFDVHHQLRLICSRPPDRNGLGMDVAKSCGDDIELFLKCVCAGLFMQAAVRVKAPKEVDGKGRSGLSESKPKYRTKLGNRPVAIHPTSTMFGRNPAPKCVVYTELVSTKKTYIRGVSQIREDWLTEVAPNFFSKE